MLSETGTRWHRAPGPPGRRLANLLQMASSYREGREWSCECHYCRLLAGVRHYLAHHGARGPVAFAISAGRSNAAAMEVRQDNAADGIQLEVCVRVEVYDDSGSSLALAALGLRGPLGGRWRRPARRSTPTTRASTQPRRSRQDLAGAVHGPCAGARVRQAGLRRAARRDGPARPQQDLEGRAARLDPAREVTGGQQRPGVRARRDRQARPRAGRGPARGARPGAERPLPRRIRRAAVRPLRGAVHHDSERGGADPASAA